MCSCLQGLAKEKPRISTEQGLLHKFKSSLHYSTLLNPGLMSLSLFAGRKPKLEPPHPCPMESYNFPLKYKTENRKI